LQRLKDYTREHGYNLGKIVRFVDRGLKGSAGSTGFTEECLDGELSAAQKWVLLNIYLGEQVPELLRNPEIDENGPKMVTNLFPDEDVPAKAGNIVTKAVKKISSPLRRGTSAEDLLEDDIQELDEDAGE
jgi:hypothetical protein